MTTNTSSNSPVRAHAKFLLVSSECPLQSIPAPGMETFNFDFPRTTLFCEATHVVEAASSKIFFEGHACDDTGLYCQGGDLRSVQRFAVKNLGSSFRTTTGNFSCVMSRGDDIAAFTDPLGMGMLFLFEDSATKVVSNDIYSLARFVRSLGCKLTLNNTAIAATLVFDTIKKENTLFNEIRAVPAGKYAAITANGIVIEDQWTWNFLMAGNYNQALDEACESIISTLRTYVSALPEREHVVSLTGGLDSRIILAGVLAAGLKQEFTFGTSGPESSEDQIYAKGLRNQFGLAHHTGSTDRVEDASASFNLWVESTMGLRPIEYRNICTHSQVPLQSVNYGGYSGEILKGFYSSAALLRSKISEKESALSLDFFTIQSWLRKQRDENWITDISVIEELMDKPVAEGLLHPLTATDISYLMSRNRSHFGLFSRITSRSAINCAPIASLAVLKASLLCDPYDRTLNRGSFDVLRRLSPTLVHLPGTFSVPREFRQWSDLNCDVQHLAMPYPQQMVSEPELSQRARALTRPKQAMGTTRWMDDITLNAIQTRTVAIIDNLSNAVVLNREYFLKKLHAHFRGAKTDPKHQYYWYRLAGIAGALEKANKLTT